MEIRRLPSVVSDAGPLIHLGQVEKLFLLKDIFKVVTITSGVKKEVIDVGIDLGYEDAFIVKQAVADGWLKVMDVSREARSRVERLVRNEKISIPDAETLVLTRESDADVLLVDERVVSELARMYGLTVWNTWTVLLEALSRGFIEFTDVEAAVFELGKHRHKLGDSQASEVLEAARIIVRKG